MSRETHIQTLIIGAGLTGLTTAFYLKRGNLPFLVLEKEAVAGGAIRTHRKGGFVYEEGPNTGVVSHPEVSELFAGLSEPDHHSNTLFEAANRAAKSRWILKNGKFHPLPSGLWEAVTTPLFAPLDKANILCEPFRKRGTNPDESVADLVRRRLGKSFLDYAVDPFISGIYAGNPDELITRVALPKLYKLEQQYGSFIRGAFAKAFQPKSPRDKLATREVFSARGGLGNLIDALTHKIGSEAICYNASILEISVNNTGNSIGSDSGNGSASDSFSHSGSGSGRNSGSGFRVRFSVNGKEQTLYCRNLISTVAAHQLPALFPFIGREQMERLQTLEYAPVVQVAVGYRNLGREPFKAFGGLIPRLEKQDVLGILFPSSCFIERAPEEGALFSLFIGGKGKPHLTRLSNADIAAISLNACHKLLALPAQSQPDLLEIFRHPAAIPQYGKGHDERCNAIEILQQQYRGLHLAGNIRNGIGMADRILQATQIAKTLIKQGSGAER